MCFFPTIKKPIHEVSSHWEEETECIGFVPLSNRISYIHNFPSIY